MKASMHCGREGSGRHNDRSFLQDKTEQEKREMAPHIDLSKTESNLVLIRKDGALREGTDIEAAERRFYKERYGAAQEAKNARYRANRHPERQKSTEDLYKGKQTRPEEIILQIGSKDDRNDRVDRLLFGKCVNDYLKELNAWNDAHGDHMKMLSVALHGDEASCHAHLRRVWEYDSKDGPRLGQEKALEAAGVPLPYPDKPKGRYNNRKITFDRMMRDKWIDICEQHGLEIDREPVPDMRHKNKADYIRDQIAADIANAKRERDAARCDMDARYLKAEVSRLRDYMSKVEYSDGHTVLDDYERKYHGKAEHTRAEYTHGRDDGLER